jgi:hypothetical protein
MPASDSRRFYKKLLERESEIIEALFGALKSTDPRVSLEAARLALAYLHGKPTEESFADEDSNSDWSLTMTKAEIKQRLDEAERAVTRDA